MKRRVPVQKKRRRTVAHGAGATPWAEQYFRATNYLAASMVYLQDNVLLERPLRADDVKRSLLGHWGTCPGINFIYTHLNLLIHRTGANMLLLTGPGHGFAAILANLYLEGTLQERYPMYTQDKAGLQAIIKSFCWPGGFPSHLNPGVPGCIHEGGELGYALATAFGAALDNPELIVAAIVGDGEAETGPTATAWHSTKFLDPATCGAVLPILHLNGYKIANPTITGTMSDAELHALFTGYGYEPRIVGESHTQMHETLTWAYARIRAIQANARSGKPEPRPRWPMIILRTRKGWTGIERHKGKRIVGSWRSHQVPVTDVRENPASRKELQSWLASYKPRSLFPKGVPAPGLLAMVPKGDKRIGATPYAVGGHMRKPLDAPDLHPYAVRIGKRGSTFASSMEQAGKYLTEVVRRNPNFRIFSPDELGSNKLDAVLAVTKRQYVWPHDKDDSTLARHGQVMEILSEHTLQAWLQGYLLTGRHGIFPSYEAFLPIVDSMVSQYVKFIQMSQEYAWRTPVSSLNYILTSVCWRQDHNGFSHQNPGFINTLLNKAKEEQLVRIYLPADANTLLNVLDHSLRSSNRVNVIVADKRQVRQWLPMKDALDQCRVGAAIWDFASHKEPDVILAAAGDYQTQESLATIQLLRDLAPDLKVRFVNVSELNVLGEKPFYPNALDRDAFEHLFPLDRQVVFSFHGYPGAVKQLLFDRQHNERFHIYGYIEKGTTTTPFDMLIRNNVSRYHLAIKAIQYGSLFNPRVAGKSQLLIAMLERLILDHRAFILEHGYDPEEVTSWSWKGG